VTVCSCAVRVPGTVYGTPLYYVNGVAVNAQADWTLAQWEQLLNPIINATRSS